MIHEHLPILIDQANTELVKLKLFVKENNLESLLNFEKLDVWDASCCIYGQLKMYHKKSIIAELEYNLEWKGSNYQFGHHHTALEILLVLATKNTQKNIIGFLKGEEDLKHFELN